MFAAVEVMCHVPFNNKLYFRNLCIGVPDIILTNEHARENGVNRKGLFIKILFTYSERNNNTLFDCKTKIENRANMESENTISLLQGFVEY